jgi:hypothetical protein
MAKRKSKTIARPADELDAEVEQRIFERHKRDEKLAMEFLIGVIEPDERGLPSLVYLSDLPDGGKREKEARAALVRLLIGPEISRGLLHALALLFDADAIDEVLRSSVFSVDPSTGWPTKDHIRSRYRGLRFHKRGRGQPTKAHTNSTIAMIVWDLIRGDDERQRPPMNRTAAIEAVRKHYKMKFETVDDIEKEWGRKMPQFRVRPRRGGSSPKGT